MRIVHSTNMILALNFTKIQCTEVIVSQTELNKKGDSAQMVWVKCQKMTKMKKAGSK